ncbi:polysaccharide lyase family 7 protein [Zobellia galactanivorans]|uniref:polysaccharide lyase family 7 protein n=1 Tax=Zobellia galactanivorans (strain DSM 12802 / CCUG 47099 / CIP 106680 / NCIMB 13871 / Dsij) TaxID=63186 RepID=UPI001C0658F6|nr:polysaccharide lyase family 7 protein [Zobellia galactanivorans]MBU3028281.1 polysaccharide lyase family 7 protein [Zobellia galactanivorans]
MKKDVFTTLRTVVNGDIMWKLIPVFFLALCLGSCSEEPVDPEEEAVLTKLSANSTAIGISSVSASTSQSPNVASNTLDGSTSTRWSGYGDGASITYDLGSSANIDYVKIAFYKGDSRKTKYEVWVGNSTSSLTKIKSKTSSGSTSDYETIDLPNSTARYIRIVGKGYVLNSGGSTVLWNSITKFQAWGSGGSSTLPISGNSPASVLGITANTWKINSFIGSPGSSATYYDDITDASGISYNTYSDDNYFYTDGEWVYFKCYRGLGGSANSQNPRVELREMDNGNLASWTGDSGTHTMEWTVQVNQLPQDTDGDGGVLCFGQIHGPSKNSDGVEVDDVVRVQFIGEENQSSGSVKLKISGYVTEEQGGSQTFSGYSLDTTYNCKLVYSGGYVELFMNGSSVFRKKMEVDDLSENYFKVGNYLQSVKGASYTGSYGLVRIKNLSVTHN